MIAVMPVVAPHAEFLGAVLAPLVGLYACGPNTCSACVLWGIMKLVETDTNVPCQTVQTPTRSAKSKLETALVLASLGIVILIVPLALEWLRVSAPSNPSSEVM